MKEIQENVPYYEGFVQVLKAEKEGVQRKLENFEKRFPEAKPKEGLKRPGNWSGDGAVNGTGDVTGNGTGNETANGTGNAADNGTGNVAGSGTGNAADNGTGDAVGK